MILYNDNDKFCCQWLRNLVDAGHLPAGRVECEDIRKLDASTFPETCHFFAGIGGWPLALKLAGWTEPVWTGSCPCQPLSCAGKRKGHADERHLWPDFYSLIAKRRPSTIFGEQVASKDGREWLSGVRADLEGIGYAVGSADLCAAGISSPQIRQRIYWVASAQSKGHDRQGWSEQKRWAQSERGGESGHLAGSATTGWRQGIAQKDTSTVEVRVELSGASVLGGTNGKGLEGGGVRPWVQHDSEGRQSEERRSAEAGFWSNFDICHFTGPDSGKSRRIEPGTFPLAHGVPARVGRLRAYGNAIVVPLAVEFIKAVMET